MPSETGAAKAVGLVIPQLKGKFTGMAFRAHTYGLSYRLHRAAFKRRDCRRDQCLDEGTCRRQDEGILAYSEDPLVSSDLVGDAHSSIFSALDTLVIGGNMAKVIAWYDNEWGYSMRVADLVAYVAMKQSESEQVVKEAA